MTKWRNAVSFQLLMRLWPYYAQEYVLFPFYWEAKYPKGVFWITSYSRLCQWVASVALHDDLEASCADFSRGTPLRSSRTPCFCNPFDISEAVSQNLTSLAVAEQSLLRDEVRCMDSVVWPWVDLLLLVASFLRDARLLKLEFSGEWPCQLLRMDHQWIPPSLTGWHSWQVPYSSRCPMVWLSPSRQGSRLLVRLWMELCEGGLVGLGLPLKNSHHN